ILIFPSVPSIGLLRRQMRVSLWIRETAANGTRTDRKPNKKKLCPEACLQESGGAVLCRNSHEVAYLIGYLFIGRRWYDLTQQERQNCRAHIHCGRIGGGRAPDLHSQHLDRV